MESIISPCDFIIFEEKKQNMENEYTVFSMDYIGYTYLKCHSKPFEIH